MAEGGIADVLFVYLLYCEPKQRVKLKDIQLVNNLSF